MKRILLMTLLLWAAAFGESAETNLPPVLQSPSDTNSAAKVAADYGKYKKGQIDKGQMIQSVRDANNQTRQDRYGKVVDQDGQPVAGVDVTGTIEFIQADKPDLHYKTQTDTNGLFQFTGLHGAGLAVKVAKAGYEMDYQGAAFEPSGQSSPANRVIFMMWKLRGPEPMKHVKLHSYIPCDGNVTRFDLLTGNANPNGDLSVSLTRNPLNIDRKKPFDWILTLEITNGGFQLITNIYPNEAPTDGYQSRMIFHYGAVATNWTSQIQPKLYFKGENGRFYGQMTLKVMTDFQPPPTLFDAEIYANPGGSRNLEFDPNKEIEH